MEKHMGKLSITQIRIQRTGPTRKTPHTLATAASAVVILLL